MFFFILFIATATFAILFVNYFMAHFLRVHFVENPTHTLWHVLFVIAVVSIPMVGMSAVAITGMIMTKFPFLETPGGLFCGVMIVAMAAQIKGATLRIAKSKNSAP